MRLIKFRAIIPERNAVIFFTLEDLIQNKFSNREILWKWIKAGNKPDEFTGLHDKHGKEIFEGDVVRFWGGKGHIIYFETYAQFKIQYGENDLFDIDHTTEIIGNIYENPELI
jgi:hypothetical protein